MSKEKYHVFYNEHQNKLPIFVHPWYLDAVCNDGEWNAAAVEQNNKIIAVLPYFIKRKYGFHYITMPPFVKFMGPFWAGNLNLTEQHEVLQQLILQLPKVDAFTQNFYYNITNWLPFYWQGFQQTTRYSYHLPITDLDQMYHHLNRNMQRNIKKAQNIVKVTQENAPELFYDINKLSFQRQSLAMPYTREQFLRHDAALAAHSARAIFLAKDATGQVHSAAYLVWDAHRSYYHLSGDDPALRQSGAGILLIWEAIRFSRNQLGVQTFDFEGSMMPNVEAIRRQFGAVQVPYFTVWKNYTRLLQFVRFLSKKH